MPSWRWTMRAGASELRQATRRPLLLQALASGVWWLDVVFGLAYRDHLDAPGAWTIVGAMVVFGAVHIALQIAWLGPIAPVLPLVRPPTGFGYLVWLWFTPHGRGVGPWLLAIGSAVGVVAAVFGPGE